MKYKIVKKEAFLVVGVKAKASFVTNGQVTGQLARSFMPRRNEVQHRVDDFALSLQNYEYFDFRIVNPNTTFEKWIGVEVSSFEPIPKDMDILKIDTGNYLVIDFKGSIPEFIKEWQHIHSVWLPNSEFELDNRPHFERLSPSYNPMQEVNEEEIWIPVK